MKIGDTASRLADYQRTESKSAAADPAGSFVQQLEAQMERLNQVGGTASTSASDAATLSVDFTNMTRSEMFDWMNEQIRNGDMTIHESTAFLPMTIEIPVDGNLERGSSVKRIDFIEMTKQGIEGALWRNDLAAIERLEFALETMTSVQSMGSTRAGSSAELSPPANANSSLEDHALPSWMARYSSPLNDLSLSESAIEETRHGVHGPANEAFKQRSVERERLQSELNEFSVYRNQAYDSALQHLGLTPAAAQALRKNPTVNQLLHDAFRKDLLSNPRAESLMNTLGIDPG